MTVNGTDKVLQPIAACHAAAFALELLVQWGLFYPKEVAGPPTIMGAPPSTTVTEAPEQSGPALAHTTGNLIVPRNMTLGSGSGRSPAWQLVPQIRRLAILSSPDL
jgi:hypothetical protein